MPFLKNIITVEVGHKCGYTMFRKLFLILHKDELKEEPCNEHKIYRCFLPTKKTP